MIAGGTYDGRQAAYEVLAGDRRVHPLLTTRVVERRGRGIDNWASVDTFATAISGVAWREGRVTDAAVARWVASRDRWWRRTALVSTVPLNVSATGDGDATRTLAVCASLIHDRDNVVVKALSWTLRALAVRDAEAVRDCIAQREGELPARALREVRNKLASGLKNPRKGAAPRVARA